MGQAGPVRSIRWRVQGLVLACLLPAWLLVLAMSWFSYQRERDNRVQATVQMTRALAQQVDGELRRAVSSLQALATSSRIDVGDHAEFHARARQVMRDAGADNIVLFDRQLQGLVSAAHAWGTPLPKSVHDRFPQVMVRGEPAVSPVFRGQVSKKLQVAVAVPVMRGGQAIGRLEMVFTPERFSHVIEAQGFPSTWTVAVVDAEHHIVARNRDPATFVGRPASESLRQRLRTTGEGHAEGYTSDGVPTIGCFSRSPQFGWTVAIGLPTAELRAELMRGLGLVLGAGAVVLAGSLLLAHRLSCRIGEPVQALVAPALALGRGDTAAAVVAPAPTGLKEVDEVAAALQQAAVLVQQRHEAQRQAEALRVEGVRLEAENRQIQEASRLKSEFLANMSHELRTPLNAVIGFADILRSPLLPLYSPKRDEYLGHIAAGGRHLLQLINDVLDLAKVESGRFEFFPAPVDLPALVQEVLGVLQAAAANKRIAIGTELDPALDDLVLDGARLKQVLYNFLSNAIKFTEPGGWVQLRLRAEGPQAWRLEVEDCGIGITEADQARLFTPFQQVSAGLTKQHGGTGLGLALTRRLVELQGGQVGVKSQPGQGSLFHAVLPRRSGAAAGLPPAAEPAGAAAADPPRPPATTPSAGQELPR